MCEPRSRVQGDEDDIEALERDISEESGWKLVHGDVFRPPAHLPVLCALVGTGVQLALLVLSTILITIAGAPSSSLCTHSGRRAACAVSADHRQGRSKQSCLQCGKQRESAGPAHERDAEPRCACRHALHGAGHHRNGVHHLLCADLVRRRLCQVRSPPGACAGARACTWSLARVD